MQIPWWHKVVIVAIVLYGAVFWLLPELWYMGAGREFHLRDVGL